MYNAGEPSYPSLGIDTTVFPIFDHSSYVLVYDIFLAHPVYAPLPLASRIDITTLSQQPTRHQDK
jgi:hypothetical protein